MLMAASSRDLLLAAYTPEYSVLEPHARGLLRLLNNLSNGGTSVGLSSGLNVYVAVILTVTVWWNLQHKLNDLHRVSSGIA